MPSYGTFTGDTTDFSAEADLSTVSQPILENPSHGRIQWYGVVDARNQNFDTHVTITSNLIRVTSASLHSSFDSRAQIRFYNLGYEDTPLLLKDGILCESPSCNITSYTGGVLTADVSGFTDYTTAANISSVTPFACVVSSFAPPNYTLIMGLSSPYDAHGELPTESFYSYGVYCVDDIFTIETDCETGANILNLSSATNAHGTLIPSASYPYEVCISINETGITCDYTDEDIPEGSTCIVTLSSENNAHFAECDDPYDWKVYCDFEDIEFPRWRDNVTNETNSTPRINEFVQLNVTLTDDLDLNSYIFSWNNSGEFVNESPVAISGREHIVSLSRQVTRIRNEVIGWKVYFNDSAGKHNETDVFTFTVKNTFPEPPILDQLEDGADTFNRTPFFNWTSFDADNDTMIYNLSIECHGGCSVDSRNYSAIADTNFTPPTKLEFLWDDGYYYTWRVQACDPFGCGNYSEERNFTISGLVSIFFSVNATDFGRVGIGNASNTTDDDPPPLEVTNEGNVLVNLTVSASPDLFIRSGLPSSFFMIAARNETNTSYLSANTTFFPVPPAGSELQIVEGLNFYEENRTVLYDLHVSVPIDEPPGERQTVLTTIASRS